MTGMRGFIRLALFAAVSLVLLCGCQKQAPLREPLEREGGLAVVGFKDPQYSWEFLSGCLPSQCNFVDEEVLRKLDTYLTQGLRASGVKFISPAAARQCQEVVDFEQREESAQAAAFRYWLKVGKCVPCDYLLVPQLMYFREREGTEWGVDEPASVVLHMYLLDVRNEAVAGRYYFDETQKSLSENLLDMNKFFARGGKWVTAEQLAKEAIESGIRELGL